MKIIVVDDEALARDRLKRLVSRIEGCTVVGEAENGHAAIEVASDLEPDVILLDIEMPEMNGLEAAMHLTKLAVPPAIIFCTAYDEYALRAFDVHAVGYLLKPVRLAELEKVLRQCKTINRAQLIQLEDEIANEADTSAGRTHISAKTHRGIELIPIEKVVYLKADQKYVVVRHLGGEVLVDEALKEYEDTLKGFVRVHRNALVSLAHIQALETDVPGSFQLKFKEIEDRVQVSRRHVAGLRKLLEQL